MAINQNDYTPETWEAGSYLYAKQMNEISTTLDKVEEYIQAKFVDFGDESVKTAALAIAKQVVTAETADLVSEEVMTEFVIAKAMEFAESCQADASNKVAALGAELRAALLNKASAETVAEIQGVVNDHNNAIQQLQSIKADKTEVSEVQQHVDTIDAAVKSLQVQSGTHALQESLVQLEGRMNAADSALADHIGQADAKLAAHTAELASITTKCGEIEQSVKDLDDKVAADFATKAELEVEKNRIDVVEQDIKNHTTTLTQLKSDCNENFISIGNSLTKLSNKDASIDAELALKATATDLSAAVDRVQAIEQQVEGYDIEGSATAYVTSEVSAGIAKLVGAAPEDYDTLQELSEAFKSAESQISIVEASLELAKNTAEQATNNLMHRHDEELAVVNTRLTSLEEGLQTEIADLDGLTVRVETNESSISGLSQAHAELCDTVAGIESFAASLSDRHDAEMQDAKKECADALAAKVAQLQQENEATDIAVRATLNAEVVRLEADIATKAAQTDFDQLVDEVASNKSIAEESDAALAARIDELEQKHDADVIEKVAEHSKDIKKLTDDHNQLKTTVNIDITNLNNFKQRVLDEQKYAKQAHEVLSRDITDRATIIYVDDQDQAIRDELALKASKEELQQGLNACVSKIEYETRVAGIEANVATNQQNIIDHAAHLGSLDTLVDTKADATSVEESFSRVDLVLGTKADKLAIEKVVADADATLSARVDELVAADQQMTAALATTDNTAAQLAATVESNKKLAADEVVRLEQVIATKAIASEVDARAAAIEADVAELNRLVDIAKPVSEELAEKVQAAVNGLLDGAPDYMNTLKEISDAFKEMGSESDTAVKNILANIESNKALCDERFVDHGNRLVALETASKTYATQAELIEQRGRIDGVINGLGSKVDVSALDEVKSQVAALRVVDSEQAGAIATLQMRVDNDKQLVDTKLAGYVKTETLTSQYKTAAQVNSDLGTLSNTLDGKIGTNAQAIAALSTSVDGKVKAVEDRVAVLEKYDSDADLKHQELSNKIDSKVAEINTTHLSDTSALYAAIENTKTTIGTTLAAETSDRKQGDADLKIYVDQQFAVTNSAVEDVVEDVDQVLATMVTVDKFNAEVGKIVVEADIDGKVKAAVDVVSGKLAAFETSAAEKHSAIESSIAGVVETVRNVNTEINTLKVEDARLNDVKAERAEVQSVRERTTALENEVQQLQINVGTAIDTAVSGAVAKLVNSAPEALDTLGELATAFNNQDDRVQGLITSVGQNGEMLTSHGNRLTAVETSLGSIGQVYSTKAELAEQSNRVSTIEGSLTNIASGKADLTEVNAIERRVDALEDKDVAYDVMFETLSNAHNNDKAALEAADQALDAKVEQYKQQSDAKHVEIDQAIEDVQTELQLGIDAHVADFEEHKQSVQDSFELVQGRLEALEEYDVDAEAEHEAIRQEIADKIAAEEATRSSVDATLQRSIEQEVAARETEIATINQAIADHKTASTNEFNQIKVDIVNINGQLATVDTKIADAVSAHDAEVEQLVQEKVEQHVADFGQVSDEVARLEQEKATKEALAAEVTKLTDAISSTDTTLTETKDHLTNLSKNFEVYHGVHEEKIAALEDKDVEYRNELDQLFETSRTNVSDIDMIRYSFNEHLETANAKFDKKADKVDVEEGLNSKADLTVFSEFKQQAEEHHAEMVADIATKASKEELAAVDAKFAGKVDASVFETFKLNAEQEHSTIEAELVKKADKADVKTGLDSKADLIDFNAFKKEAEEKHGDLEEAIAAKVATIDFEQFKQQAISEHSAFEAAIEAVKAEIVAGDKLKADLNALNSHVIDFNQFKSMYEDMIAEMKAEIAQLRNYVRELQGKVEGAEQLKDTTPVVLESVFSTDMVAQSNSATKKAVGNLTIECGMLMNQSDDETKETTYNFVSNVGDVTIGDMTVSDSILNVTAGPTLDQINADQNYNDATTVVKKVTAETMPSKSNVDGNGNWTSSQATKIVENDLVVDGGALTRQDEVETHETTYNFKSTSGSATFNNITVNDSIMNVTAGPALGA